MWEIEAFFLYFFSSLFCIDDVIKESQKQEIS